MKGLILLICIILTTNLFGQNEYKYSFKLNAQSSNNTIAKVDTLASYKGYLDIKIFDNQNEQIFGIIEINGGNLDTILSSDFNGESQFELYPGIYKISIKALGFSPITIKNLR